MRNRLDENTCRKPLTPVEASKARERRAKVLAPGAAERERAGVKQPSSKLDEGSQGRPLTPVEAAQARDAREAELGSATARATRKVAAVGTGYSGSTLDKVDVIRDAAERGVVRRGKKTVPAPEPVGRVAFQC